MVSDTAASYLRPRDGRALVGASRAQSPPHTPSAADVLPPELSRLLDASIADRDAAWRAFVSRFSRLLLHMARSVMGSHDATMDAYAHLLERLSRDDHRALRIYAADGRSQFTTWLAVVARRICVDFHRQRYGRPRGEAPTERTQVERAARLRLATLTATDVELVHLTDQAGDADVQLRVAELHRALDAAMAGLDPEDRLLLKLRFEDDVPVQEIASVLSLPTPFHVYRRLKNICRALRERLQARGIENSAP